MYFYVGTSKTSNASSTQKLLQHALQIQADYVSFSGALKDCIETSLEKIVPQSPLDRPTESEVTDVLDPLVDWELLAHHLPDLTEAMIDEIRKEQDTNSRKKSLISKWLLNPNASWKQLITALVKCEKSLSSKLRGSTETKENTQASNFESAEPSEQFDNHYFFIWTFYIICLQSLKTMMEKLTTFVRSYGNY